MSLLNLQDGNSELQNSSVASLRSNDRNSVQHQISKMTVSEAKADVYQQGERKIDSNSVHFVGTGPNSSNVILPLNTSFLVFLWWLINPFFPPCQNIPGSEPINKEDEEVRKMIRECLDLRQNYLYREMVSPWMKVVEDDVGASEVKSDPFHFKPVEASAVSHSLCLSKMSVFLSMSVTVSPPPLFSIWRLSGFWA